MSLPEKRSLQILQQAVDNYDKVAVACSFGKDSVVTVHLAQQIDPNISIFSVMTRYKPEVTRAFKTYLTKLWNLNITTFESDVPVAENLHITNPDECCKILKVEPTKLAIKTMELDAWIAGLRRDEGYTRTDYKEFEIYKCDLGEDLIKVNPIIHWSEVDIWKYIAHHHLPVIPLYFEGYRSLGCEKCSKPYTIKERGGRWQGTDKEAGECGIHGKMYTRIN